MEWNLWKTGGIDYIDMFWSSSRAVMEPVLPLEKLLTVSVKDLSSPIRLDVNLFLLRRQLWYGKEDFVFRLTASISLHWEILAMYKDSLKWKNMFFSSKEILCKPVIAHWASGSSVILMLSWNVWRVSSLEIYFLWITGGFPDCSSFWQVTGFPTLYWKICVNSFPARNLLPALLLRAAKRIYVQRIKKSNAVFGEFCDLRMKSLVHPKNDPTPYLSWNFQETFLLWFCVSFCSPTLTALCAISKFMGWL